MKNNLQKLSLLVLLISSLSLSVSASTPWTHPTQMPSLAWRVTSFTALTAVELIGYTLFKNVAITEIPTKSLEDHKVGRYIYGIADEATQKELRTTKDASNTCVTKDEAKLENSDYAKMAEQRDKCLKIIFEKFKNQKIKLFKIYKQLTILNKIVFKDFREIDSADNFVKLFDLAPAAQAAVAAAQAAVPAAQAAVPAAQAAVAAAQAAVAAAPTDPAVQATLDDAQTALNAVQATLDNAQTALNDARAALNDAPKNTISDKKTFITKCVISDLSMFDTAKRKTIKYVSSQFFDEDDENTLLDKFSNNNKLTTLTNILCCVGVFAFNFWATIK